MASSRVLPTNDTISTFGSAGFGRGYTVASTWEAATDNNLVAGTLSESLECYADAASYSQVVTLAGATTSASYKRQIRSASGQGYNGIPGNGVVFTTTSNSSVIVLNENYAEAHNLSLTATINSTNTRNLGDAQQNDTAFIGCLGYDSVNSGALFYNAFNGVDVGNRFINCLAKNVEGYGFGASASGGLIYNCTAVSCGQAGVVTSATATAINVLSASNTGVEFSGTFNAASKNNASSDGTVPGTNSRASQTFTFVNAAGNDYHLASGDAGARGFGFDMSATYDDDVDMQTITTWSIGFDSIAGAAAITGAISEGGKASDSFLSIKQMAAAIADAAKAGEAWATSLIAQSIVSDSAKASDVLSAALSIITSISDAAKAGEAWAVSLASQLSISDIAKASDAVSVAHVLFSALTESALAGENWATSLVAPSSISESAAAEDVFSTFRTLAGSILDASDAGESWATKLIGQSALSVYASASDILSGILRLISSISESAKAGETWAISLIIQVSMSEGGVSSDAMAIAVRNLLAVSDSAFASDNMSGIRRLLSPVSSTGMAVDIYTGVMRAVADLSEGALSSDTLTSLLAAKSSTIDSAILSDEFVAQLTTDIIGILQESAQASDVFLPIQSTVNAFLEGGSVSDLILSLLKISGSVSEEVLSSDSFALFLEQLGALSESSMVADSFSSSVTLLNALADGIFAGDGWAINLSGSLLMSISDSANLSDASFARLKTYPSFSDQAMTADLLLALSRSKPVFGHGAISADLWQSRVRVYSNWTESAFASDSYLYPLAIDVGLVIASIRFSAAVAASSHLQWAVGAESNLQPSVGGSIDVDRNYN